MREYAFLKTSRPGGRRGPSNSRGDLPEGDGSPWAALIGFVGLCLLVGASSAAVNAPAMQGWYQALSRPPGTPPDWLFAPIWTVLLVMVGASAWLVWWRAPQGRQQTAALTLWGWQLLLNAVWSPAFFGMHKPALGLLVVVPLLVLITMTLVSFARQQRMAAVLMVPYLCWTGYATYLNGGFWWLNH